MKNKYKIIDDYAILYIKTRKEKIFEVLIDIDSLSKLIEFNVSWHIMYDWTIDNFYARCCEYKGMENSKPKYNMQLMHRYLFCSDNDSLLVDHINRNTLDNRKINIRLIENKNNTKNRNGKNSNNTTGYRNVSLIGGKYVVQLQVDGKNMVLGKFSDVDDAGKFAEEMRLKYYKEYAGIN